MNDSGLRHLLSSKFENHRRRIGSGRSGGTPCFRWNGLRAEHRIADLLPFPGHLCRPDSGRRGGGAGCRRHGGDLWQPLSFQENLAGGDCRTCSGRALPASGSRNQSSSPTAASQRTSAGESENRKSVIRDGWRRRGHEMQYDLLPKRWTGGQLRYRTAVSARSQTFVGPAIQVLNPRSPQW